MDTRTDAELIAAILRGEQTLYAEIVRRYQEKLYRYALGMVRDRDTAAELVQDTFVKAYSSLSTCRDTSRFSSWVFRILRNRCTDLVRHRQRYTDPPEENAFTSERWDPERDLERSETQRMIEKALAELPPEQREAFLLKHLEGQSYDEMAETLGASVSALKMRVHRAREALRAALEDVEAWEGV